MLYLLPFQWLETIAPLVIDLYQPGDTVRQYNPSLFIFGLSNASKSPYVFGNKPKAGPRNFAGNRDVDHMQFNGSIFLPSEAIIAKDHKAYLSYPGIDKDARLAGFINETFTRITGFGERFIYPVSTEPDNRRIKRLVVRYATPYFGVAGWYICTYTRDFDIQWEWIGGHEHPNYNVSWRGVFLHTRRGGVPSFNGYAWSASGSMLVDPELDDDEVDHQVMARAEERLKIEFPDSERRSKFIRVLANSYYDPDYGLKSSELSALKRSISIRSSELQPDVDVRDLLGQATQNAAERVRYFDGNTAVYIKELFELKEAILSTVKLLKGDVDLKHLADLWVSAKYGLKLTALDTLDLYDAIRRKATEKHGDLYSVTRGAARNGNEVSCNCKLYYDPQTRSGFQKANATLMEWDLFPSLANVWDIIPYSFVVDWFIDVEGFLTAIDTRTYLSVLNIITCLYSYKYRWEVWDPSDTLIGIFSATRFVRYSTYEAVEPRPTFTGSLPDIDNIVTGAALIIQRK